MGLNIIPAEKVEQYAPDCAVLEITLLCNFRCLHCGGSAGNERARELSQDEIRAVAHDLRRIGFKRVSLIGGEPFLRRDWFEIAGIIRSEGLDLTYVSNGSLFPGNPELVDKVAATQPQVIGLSLDGATPETQDRIRCFNGSFSRVMESISLLQLAGLNVSIITAVNRLNVKELPLLRNLLLGRGVAWQIQICDHNGKRFSKDWFITKEEYRQVAEFIHECASRYSLQELPIAGADDIGYFSSRYPLCSVNGDCWDGCKAGRTNVGIQSNGNVKGCDSLPDSYSEGNIRDRSLFEIWNDPESFPYTRKFTPSLLQGVCAGCRHGERCKGGCIDIADAITGHAFENTYCLYLAESGEEGQPVVSGS